MNKIKDFFKQNKYYIAYYVLIMTIVIIIGTLVQ